MSPDYDDMFTPKEMLVRLDAKIDGLRQDLVNAQANMVSKNELDIHLTTINRDKERIELQLREELKTAQVRFDAELKAYRKESQEDLIAFKNDINTSLTRLITLLGLVLAVVQVLISLI